MIRSSSELRLCRDICTLDNCPFFRSGVAKRVGQLSRHNCNTATTIELVQEINGVSTVFGEKLAQCDFTFTVSREHSTNQKLALLSINAGLMTLGASRSLIDSTLREARNAGCSNDTILESCFIAVEMATGACFGHSGQTASILEEN